MKVVLRTKVLYFLVLFRILYLELVHAYDYLTYESMVPSGTYNNPPGRTETTIKCVIDPRVSKYHFGAGYVRHR